MEQRRFDDLCRGLATGTSRRGVLKALGAGIAGAFVATAAPVAAAYDRHREDGSLGCGGVRHFDDNGACVCKPRRCDLNSHQDPDTCQCVRNVCLVDGLSCDPNNPGACCSGNCRGESHPLCVQIE